MTGSGDLRWKIAFDRRSDDGDEAGNEQGEFEEQFVVSAKVQAKFGGESVTAARLTGQQPVTITVRQSSQTRLIRENWRARDKRTGAEYAISSIADPDGKRAWLEILCQTGRAP